MKHADAVIERIERRLAALVRWPADFSTQVDYEAELAVVIGRRTQRVTDAEALGCVFGYTAANDVTARDRQWLDTAAAALLPS